MSAGPDITGNRKSSAAVAADGSSPVGNDINMGAQGVHSAKGLSMEAKDRKHDPKDMEERIKEEKRKDFKDRKEKNHAEWEELMREEKERQTDVNIHEDDKKEYNRREEKYRITFPSGRTVTYYGRKIIFDTHNKEQSMKRQGQLIDTGTRYPRPRYNDQKGLIREEEERKARETPEMEEIIDYEAINGAIYRIRWKGHDEDSDTWVKAYDIPTNMLKKFKEKHGIPYDWSDQEARDKEAKEYWKQWLTTEPAPAVDTFLYHHGITEEEGYEIEEIMDQKTVQYGKKGMEHNLFRVRWKGYNEDADSWVRESDICDTEKLQKFKKDCGRWKEYDEDTDSWVTEPGACDTEKMQKFKEDFMAGKLTIGENKYSKDKASRGETGEYTEVRRKRGCRGSGVNRRNLEKQKETHMGAESIQSNGEEMARGQPSLDNRVITGIYDTVMMMVKMSHNDGLKVAAVKQAENQRITRNNRLCITFRETKKPSHSYKCMPNCQYVHQEGLGDTECTRPEYITNGYCENWYDCTSRHPHKNQEELHKYLDTKRNRRLTK